MILTVEIELTPEQERALRTEAVRRGVTMADYAAALLEKHLPRPSASSGASDPQDRAGAFREWAESHNIDNPLLAEDAIKRRQNVPKIPEKRSDTE